MIMLVGSMLLSMMFALVLLSVVMLTLLVMLLAMSTLMPLPMPMMTTTTLLAINPSFQPLHLVSVRMQSQPTHPTKQPFHAHLLVPMLLLPMLVLTMHRRLIRISIASRGRSKLIVLALDEDRSSVWAGSKFNAGSTITCSAFVMTLKEVLGCASAARLGAAKCEQ